MAHTTGTIRVRQKWDKRQIGVAALFLAPAMLGFVVFYLRPTFIGFWNSFTDKELLRPKSEFVGVENYREMFQDDVFWNALWVTLKYVLINIGVQTVFAILIAWILDQLSGSRLLRTLFLTPWLMSNVVVALLFLWILDFRLGVMNSMLDSIGLPTQPFFSSEAWAIPTVAFINVWRHMGYTALLLFAGLQTIPKSVKEAALVDGCGEFQRFFKVTLPLLRPVLAVVLVITVIGSFQIYDTIDVTTEGGPVNASRVIYVYIFDQAFARRNFGYASAMAVALFVILAVVTVMQMRLLRANESDLA
jgi:multiple sugar transport system permease protein